RPPSWAAGPSGPPAAASPAPAASSPPAAAPSPVTPWARAASSNSAGASAGGAPPARATSGETAAPPPPVPLVRVPDPGPGTGAAPAPPAGGTGGPPPGPPPGAVAPGPPEGAPGGGPAARSTVMVVVRNSRRPSATQRPDTAWRPGRGGGGTGTVARATPSGPTRGAATSQRSMPIRATVRGVQVRSVTVIAWPGAGVGSSTLIDRTGGG